MAHSVSTRTRASYAMGIAAIALIALGLILPAFASRGLIQDLFFILTMLTLAQFWNLLAGFGGLVSVGQQAFVGLGGYGLFGAAILWGMDPVLALPLSGLFALAVAVPTAFFAFRLAGAYFAIGTWVAAEIVRLLIAQWKTIGGGTGTSLPREVQIDMAGVGLVEQVFDVRTAAAEDILAYLLALALTVCTIGGIYLLLRSKTGLALSATRDNPEAARAVGVKARWLNWLIYLTAAFGTGLTGGLIYLQQGRISPDAAFSVTDWTAYVIFIAVIGGMGTIEGPIIGILVFFALQTLFADFGPGYLLALGLIGIAVMLFAPRGLWGLFSVRTGVQLFPIRRRLQSHPDNHK